ncbi:hypothetical protein G7Y79_00057g090740 [Physcia stellaris]|nr:hypothetical protein G7Y79_00057g090740 [Physcia stellaris]
MDWHEQTKFVEAMKDISRTLLYPTEYHSQCGTLHDTLVRQHNAVEEAFTRLPDCPVTADKTLLTEAVKVLRGQLHHCEIELEAGEKKLADIKLHVEHCMVLLRDVKADHAAGKLVLAPLLILRMFQVENAVGAQRKLEKREQLLLSRVKRIRDRIQNMHTELNSQHATEKKKWTVTFAKITIEGLKELPAWHPIPPDIAIEYDKGLKDFYKELPNSMAQGGST